jgi:hypothetical protein
MAYRILTVLVWVFCTVGAGVGLGGCGEAVPGAGSDYPPGSLGATDCYACVRRECAAQEKLCQDDLECGSYLSCENSRSVGGPQVISGNSPSPGWNCVEPSDDKSWAIMQMVDDCETNATDGQCLQTCKDELGF